MELSSKVLSPGVSADLAEVSPSAVSSSAIVAGTLVATSTTLILVTLGAGFGLAALSPWPRSGASPGAFAMSTAIGMIVVQWVSSILGGYITGRLRTRWVRIHEHEVFFRDTAHGLITWAAATIIVAGVVAVGAGTGAGAAGHAASAATSVMAAAEPSAVQAYDIDTLLRPANAQSPSATPEIRAEAGRLVAQGQVSGNMSETDRAYLAQLVSTQTGLSAGDAQSRIDTLIAKRNQAEQKARQAADEARRLAETTSLFTGFAMLVGAFIASVSAAIGGRLRDLHP